jgi:hypothetical protein
MHQTRVLHQTREFASLTMAFSVASWNIAAVNNNPFEYWVTHDSPSYNALMQGVQAFLDAPGDDDLPVSQVRS